MRQQWRRWAVMVLALTLGIGSLPPLATAQDLVLPTPAVVLTDQEVGFAITDGEYLVFHAVPNRNSTQAQGARVLAQPLAGGPTVEVWSPERGRRPYDMVVDNGLVAWVDYPCVDCGADIYGQDIRTGRAFTIATTLRTETSPMLSGSRVVWRDAAYDTVSITMRDLATMAPPITVYTGPISHGISEPVIAGDHVIWSESTGSAAHPQRWILRATRLGTSTIATLAAGEHPIRYDAVGDVLVFGGIMSPITIQNLATGATQRLADGGIYPTTDGRYVFWAEARMPEGPVRIPIHGYDTQTHSRFVAVAPMENQRQLHPQTRKGWLVWHRIIGTTQHEVYAQETTLLLPSRRRPAPPSQPQTGRYFPESGHFLTELAFERFWRSAGGLAVFGYPQTERFDQQTAATTPWRTVQYLERQRFEHHPEHTGTAYEVQLGLLGVEALQRQGVEWRALPTADPVLPHYYPQTSQATAPEFWDYWRTHGLEFGDPGVSHAEALALFGYPISPVQWETNSSGDRVLTQWFERARFEYHPANPTAYRVLLGRLAAEELAAQGW